MTKSLTNQETSITLPVYDITNCGPRHRYMANGKLVHNSDKLNVQNLSKRTKEPVLRRSMTAGQGNVIVATDSSNIEVRVGAYIADQQDVIEVFRKGGDVYIDMATKIYNESYEDIYEQSKGANVTKEGKMKRNVAKAVVLGCISHDTEVLCKRGWIAIQDIQDDDLLWDGETWVTHDGVVPMGEKDCIDFGGVDMTPDHKVYNGIKWEEAQYADVTEVTSWAIGNLPDTE